MHVDYLHHRTQLVYCSSLRLSHPAFLRNRRNCFGQQISVKKFQNRRATSAACASAAGVTERYEEAAGKNPIRPLKHPFASWHQWWYIGKLCRCSGAYSAPVMLADMCFYRCYTSVRATKVADVQQDMRQTMGDHEAQQNIPVLCRDIHGQYIPFHHMRAACWDLRSGIPALI